MSGNDVQIKVSDLTMAYGDFVLLKDASFEVRKQDIFIIMGASGGGKSSLLRLLTGLMPPTKGKIVIDGVDFTALNTAEKNKFMRRCGILYQSGALFSSMTLAENIAFGKRSDEIDAERLQRAIRAASLTELVASLPQGTDTVTGEAGCRLSGGQRQRIGIARALYRRADVLFFDEATSALDSESEHYIQEALRDLMKGKTVIAIAHRLSTLKEMNKIVVMEKGKIVEEGSHATLLRKKGAYYNFYKMQSAGFLLPDGGED